ncbi:hypothetical protein [Candidatus Poriferisocius sp.]|uniref:hypothetical protein n=1 Tax=Candidatus Poriferisocius sp. TaxID=3101276 RepID=UPI003B59765A
MDQLISDVDIVLVRKLRENPRNDGVWVDASPWDKIDIGAEKATVGVKQVFLIGNEFVAQLDIVNGNRSLS